MAPLFSVFLLYFVIFLYGEFSNYLEVRYSSRILFYGLSANIAIIHYLPPDIYTMGTSGLILFITLLYLAKTTTILWFSRILVIPICVLLINYSVVFFQPETLTSLLPNWYMEHSDKVFREGFLLLLGVLSFMHGNKDEKLNYISILLYVTEYSLTL